MLRRSGRGDNAGIPPGQFDLTPLDRARFDMPKRDDRSRLDDIVERTIRVAATHVDTKSRDYIERDGRREYE